MKQRLISLLSDLVAINSVNATLAGGPGESEIAAFIRLHLGRMGFESEVRALPGGGANVTALVRGAQKRPALVLNGHIDTVGVDGMAAPFALRQEGDRLYGRGAYDMKGGVAVMLALAETWAEDPPGRSVWLTFSADEEDKSLGTEEMVRNWLPGLDPAPGGAVFLEPTEENIGVAHKGFTWFEIEISGMAAHGSRPEQGIDAILPLRGALEELERIRCELKARKPDPLLGPASLHGGRIEGGSALSVIPARARLQWERRTLPGETDAALDAELARVAAAVERLPGGHRVSGRRVFSRPAYRTPPDAGIVEALRRAAPGARPVGISFWADSALMGAAGIPSVLYGPAGHGAHAVDEWVSAGSLLNVYTGLIKAVENP
jgi:acetylornithine deacetylase